MIVSLVVDENSKTEFVKKVNRLVVLLSRARLGLYILGNTGYFESKSLPRHWSATLELLQSPAVNDNGSDDDHLHNAFEGKQTGSLLPLCCPLHRSITFHAKSFDDLKLGFCTETCAHKLLCGHTCSLPCHWPKKDHKKQCTAELDSPCNLHPGKITCHSAFLHARRAPRATEHTEILQYYKCPVSCSVTLPCGHAINKPCNEERLLLEGKQQMPSCSKQSPIPYIFATSCGHTKPVTCDELVLFNANPTMTKCDEDEVYDSPCGHSKPIKCWKKTRILDKNEVFVCDKKRSMNLPRCGHKQKVPCSTAERIDEWSGVSCEVVGVIKEGVSYGMQDHPCHDKAVLQRICGHTLMLPCSEAFAKLRSLDSCREPVTALHPSCGHACQITCKLAADLKDQNVNSPEVPDRVKEGEVPPRAIFRGIPKCNAKVNYVRKCGHVEQLSCSEVLAPKHGCRVESTTKSPICGHDINIPCFLKPEIEQIQQNHSGFIPSIFNAATRLATVVGLVAPKDISTLSNDARKAIASCALESNITLSCGHDTVVKCAKLPSLSEKKGVETNNCQKKIEVCLPCGHNAEMTCNHSRLYKQGLLDVKCIGKKQVKCWNYSHCSSNLEVDCSFDGIAACANVTSWTCPSKAHEYKLSICSKGKPQDCLECCY